MGWRAVPQLFTFGQVGRLRLSGGLKRRGPGSMRPDQMTELLMLQALCHAGYFRLLAYSCPWSTVMRSSVSKAVALAMGDRGQVYRRFV